MTHRQIPSKFAQFYEKQYLCAMNENLHEEIVWANDASLIHSPAFIDCVIHLLCISGSAVFSYNGSHFSIQKGDIAVISRPELVKGLQIGENFQCEFIAAPEKFLHSLLPANNYSIQGCVSLFDNPVMHVSEEDAQRFKRDIDNIRLRLPDRDHRFYKEMIGGLLQTMIYDLFDFHSKETENILTTDRVGYIVSQFLTLMESGRPKTQREVSYYAGLLHVTPKYLSDTVKRVTGHSTSDFINRATTAIIIEFLKDNKYSITQIADEMRFASVSYFSRYCSKHLGMSPQQYRTAGAKVKTD